MQNKRSTRALIMVQNNSGHSSLGHSKWNATTPKVLFGILSIFEAIYPLVSSKSHIFRKLNTNIFGVTEHCIIAIVYRILTRTTPQSHVQTLTHRPAFPAAPQKSKQLCPNIFLNSFVKGFGPTATVCSVLSLRNVAPPSCLVALTLTLTPR